MRDFDIRAELHAFLMEQHGKEPGTLIRHELGLCTGQRRVDVAVINGELAGYEIKSDEDTLARLAGQAEAYGRVLDRALLVTATKHLAHALELLPQWWGVVTATSERGHVKLTSVREPLFNEAHDRFALAQLLWREEALDELRQRGLATGLSKRARHYVWSALATALQVHELRDVVRSRLKARQEWPGGQPHVPYGANHPIQATL